MKTIYLTLDLSIDEDVDPGDVASTLFLFLVDNEDLPEIIQSVDGVEVRSWRNG